MEEFSALVALSRLKGMNNLQKRSIVAQFDDIRPIFAGKTRIHDRTAMTHFRSFRAWNEIEGDIARLTRMGIRIVSIRDDDYPAALRAIPDAPIILYLKGTPRFHFPMFAIVGARKATSEGINMAEKIAQTLSSLGITIVSGLARGIDTSAHRGAVREKGGTIAVLGSGIDICYPAENRSLYEKIGTEGTLLTEYEPGARPMPYHFPARNRIIAGLSKGILVIEASQRSGSLITARLGLEYNREIMAIPGNILYEEQRGANTLIKQGARLVDSIEDIIHACFPDLQIQKRQMPPLDEEETRIFSVIGFKKIHIDEIIERSNMNPKNVLATITKLEMKELVREVMEGFYLRSV